MRIQTARLVGLCAVAALSPGCEDAGKIAALEARKAELLETRVPRAEFWAEVERKGQALGARKPLDAGIAAARAKAAAASEAAERVRAALGEASEVNAQAEEVRARIAAEADRLAAQVAEQEAALRGFDARRTAPAGGASS